MPSDYLFGSFLHAFACLEPLNDKYDSYASHGLPHQSGDVQRLFQIWVVSDPMRVNAYYIAGGGTRVSRKTERKMPVMRRAGRL